VLVLVELHKFSTIFSFSGRSDDSSSKENTLQPEGLDLLPVFRFPGKVHLEKQE